MKTIAETKRGLECCKYSFQDCGSRCPYFKESNCKFKLNDDAVGHLERLEAENEAHKQSAINCCYESRCNARIKELEDLCGRLADEKKQLERERNAAVDDLKSLHTCETCRYEIFAGSPRKYTCQIEDFDCDECSEKGCPCMFCRRGSNWEWRGVKEDVDND